MEPAVRLPIPIAHDRPAQGEAHELLAFQRVLLLMRIAGVIVLVAMTPLYPEANLGLVALALATITTTIVVQPRLINDEVPLPVLRRRSLYCLVADILTV